MRVLVLGDVMIDEYTYVQTSRRAPEASMPVWDVVREERRLGGAANVANNVKALGGDDVDVFLCGIGGLDIYEIARSQNIDTRLLCAGKTMVKHRYVDQDGKYLFRCDNFTKFKQDAVNEFCNRSAGIIENMPKFDAVVVSDYDKGSIDEMTVCMLLQRPDDGLGFEFKYDPIVVDSKRRDLSIFEGASVIKLNESEFAAQQPGVPAKHCKNLVVTRGSNSTTLFQYDLEKSSDYKYVIHSEDFPVERVRAVDVTGCGDTHTAAMAFSLMKNPGDVRAAVKFANACARNVVQKFGTSVCL